MTNNDDPRDDRESALHLIRQQRLWWATDMVAADDADDETREMVRRNNEEHAQRRESARARLEAGRFFIDEAVIFVGAQRGLDEAGQQALSNDMLRCAALPDDHKHKLIVRDPVTLIPVQHGVRVSLARIVYRADVNAWLDATGAGYRWNDAQQSDAPPPKPVQRQATQNAATLAKLAELGINAHAVPTAPPGKPSPAKQAVRAALGYSEDVMNKAWQRLRTAGEIKDA